MSIRLLISCFCNPFSYSCDVRWFARRGAICPRNDHFGIRPLSSWEVSALCTSHAELQVKKIGGLVPAVKTVGSSTRESPSQLQVRFSGAKASTNSIPTRGREIEVAADGQATVLRSLNSAESPHVGSRFHSTAFGLTERTAVASRSSTSTVVSQPMHASVTLWP